MTYDNFGTGKTLMERVKEYIDDITEVEEINEFVMHANIKK